MAGKKIIIDAHSHMYDCFDLPVFISFTFKNLDSFFQARFPNINEFKKVVCLTEAKNNNYFEALKNGDVPLSDDLKIRKTREDISFILEKSNGSSVIFLKGRQIVSREKIEVLSIASNVEIKDGLPLKEILKRLIKNQNIAVLAWGVGKWWFKRGKIINNIINTNDSPFLFTGDNSGRPLFWPMPRLINSGLKKDIRLLSGSDPLPLTKEENKSGSFGMIIEGDISTDYPGKTLTDLLCQSKPNTIPFGNRDSLALFLSRQIRIYTRKYLKL